MGSGQSKLDEHIIEFQIISAVIHYILLTKVQKQGDNGWGATFDNLVRTGLSEDGAFKWKSK